MNIDSIVKIDPLGLARFHGALVVLVYFQFHKHAITQHEVRFSNYEGFHLIDIQWNVQERRYSHRQPIALLEVYSISTQPGRWKDAARNIAAKIEATIKLSRDIQSEALESELQSNLGSEVFR